MLELHFEEIGLELSPTQLPGFVSGCHEGTFEFDPDGSITSIALKLSRYDHEARAYVYKLLELPVECSLYRQLSEQIAAVYAGDIADCCADYLSNKANTNADRLYDAVFCQ